MTLINRIGDLNNDRFEAIKNEDYDTAIKIFMNIKESNIRLDELSNIDNCYVKVIGHERMLKYLEDMEDILNQVNITNKEINNYIKSDNIENMFKNIRKQRDVTLSELGKIYEFKK